MQTNRTVQSIVISARHTSPNSRTNRMRLWSGDKWLGCVSARILCHHRQCVPYCRHSWNVITELQHRDSVRYSWVCSTQCPETCGMCEPARYWCRACVARYAGTRFISPSHAATPVMEPEVVLVVHHVQALDSGHFNVSKSSEKCERLMLAFVRSLSHTLHSSANSLLVNMFLKWVVLVFHLSSHNSMSASTGVSPLLLGRAASSRFHLLLSR
jgi:hypothetical protein